MIHQIHKYKYSHDNRRMQFRKWRKKGYVKLMYCTGDLLAYKASDGYEIERIGKDRYKIHKVDGV